MNKRYFFNTVTAFSFLFSSLVIVSPVLATDITIRSCCTLSDGSGVKTCHQFADTISGSGSTEQVSASAEANAVRTLQAQTCQNVPYVMTAESGRTARNITNDAENSGVCGTALSSACAAANVNKFTSHVVCTADSQCISSLYKCEANRCKLKDGSGCVRGDAAAGTDPQSNCVSGTLCRTTPSGPKCLSPSADVNAVTPSPSAAGGSGSSGSTERPFTPVVPELGVPIPGFEFSPAVESNGEIIVPYIGQYVNALYRYMTAVVLTIAIVMITYGGFRYLLAATPFHVQDGKKIILDALIGMGLVLGAYVILNTINPTLLNLPALHLQQVTPDEVEISLQYGGAADDSAYSSEESGALSSADPAAPGTWRAKALAVCGDSNVSGMSLAQRKERLKTIVATWTDLAAMQKGSIYIRGGSLACSPTSAEYKYKAKILNGIRNAGYAVNVPTECLAEATAEQESCKAPLSSEYRRLAADPGNRNGLICGDCASYQRSLYKCFGGMSYHTALASAMFRTSGACENYTPGPDDVGFIKVTGRLGSRSSNYDETELQNFYNRLQFGDVLMWSSNSRVRHVFMYTGKAGLPYELVEMGAGGQGDVAGGADGKPYWRNVGLGNFDGSHVKAHRSAYNYLKSTPRSGAACIKAIRVIDN